MELPWLPSVTSAARDQGSGTVSRTRTAVPAAAGTRTSRPSAPAWAARRSGCTCAPPASRPARSSVPEHPIPPHRARPPSSSVTDEPSWRSTALRARSVRPAGASAARRWRRFLFRGVPPGLPGACGAGTVGPRGGPHDARLTPPERRFPGRLSRGAEERSEGAGRAVEGAALRRVAAPPRGETDGGRLSRGNPARPGRLTGDETARDRFPLASPRRDHLGVAEADLQLPPLQDTASGVGDGQLPHEVVLVVDDLLVGDLGRPGRALRNGHGRRRRAGGPLLAARGGGRTVRLVPLPRRRGGLLLVLSLHRDLHLGGGGRLGAGAVPGVGGGCGRRGDARDRRVLARFRETQVDLGGAVAEQQGADDHPGED